MTVKRKKKFKRKKLIKKFIIKFKKKNNNNKINKINSSEGRIFLCTLYNNEAEAAYIHIWRLYNYVDKFIIVISNLTHSGKPKVFSLEPFEKNIKPFMDKIDFAFFVYSSNNFKSGIRERMQRDYAKTYIEEKYNPTEKDLLIVVDIDEILTREGIEYIKNNPPNHFKFIKGAMYFPYYYHKVADWNSGYVIRYNKNMKKLSEYRETKFGRNNLIQYKDKPSKPLITHCTYCFKNIEEYKIKLKSFLHQEFNKPPYTTNDWIFKSHYCRRKVNSHHNGYDEPYEGWKHLIPDDARLKYLFNRSYTYNISETNYTEKDLDNLCEIKYNRTPFE